MAKEIIIPAASGERSNPDDPGSVVHAFIAAMNAWEIAAHKLARAARGSDDSGAYWPEVQSSMERVFAEFCTKKPRPQGRAGSFRHPPEYDPAKEQVTEVVLKDSRTAHVHTQRESVLGGGHYVYVLKKTAGLWLIDNLKFRERDGALRQTIL